MQKQQTTLDRNPIIWVKDFLHLARPYWKSEEKYKAFSLIILIIIFNLLTVAMTVIFNKWNNGFYDSLQNYDKKAFTHLLIQFTYLAFFYIVFQILAYYFRKILELRWRKWSTNYYINSWLKNKAFYKTKFLSQISDNPDQRISEDINSYIVISLDLTLGLMNSVVTLVSFVFILWKLSGSFSFTIATHHFTIYGYMVWLALIYSVVATYIMFKIGRPLIRLDYQQQAYEASFRYSLVRVREYSENIALYNGETKEHNNLMHRYMSVFNNFIAIIYRQMKINIFNVGYGQIAIILPTLLVAGRYFAKTIKLGDVMQIADAFGRVQGALSYFIDAYTSLSGWRATMDRLLGFEKAVEQASYLTAIEIKPGDSMLKLHNLSLNLPNGDSLAKGITFTLNAGDRVLIKGRSGCGKTTLLRAISGLWHFATGDIYQKPQITSLFISQKPYLPIDSLAHTICYPKTQHLPSHDELEQILKQCGLVKLTSKLHEVNDWSNILSVGEQQRIAFCRILVNKPNIVYLDEATSALDEETEAELYELLVKQLPDMVIVSIAHRSSVAKWHTQELNFNQLVS